MIPDANAGRPGNPLAFPLSATVLTLMALFTLPVATVALPAQPVLMGLFLLAVCLLNGLTAAILCMLLLAGSPLHSLTWVAAAYAFSAVMAVMQMLAFAGIFGPAPLVGGSGQRGRDGTLARSTLPGGNRDDLHGRSPNGHAPTFSRERVSIWLRL